MKHEVICIDPIEGFLSYGKVYIVAGERQAEGRFVMIDDNGNEGWFNKDRFQRVYDSASTPTLQQVDVLVSDWLYANPTLSPRLVLMDTNTFLAFQDSFTPRERIPQSSPGRLKSLRLNSIIQIDVAEIVTEEKVLEVI